MDSQLPTECLERNQTEKLQTKERKKENFSEELEKFDKVQQLVKTFRRLFSLIAVSKVFNNLATNGVRVFDIFISRKKCLRLYL